MMAQKVFGRAVSFTDNTEEKENKGLRYPWVLIKEIERMFDLDRSHSYHPLHVPDVFVDWEEVKVETNMNGNANCMCGKEDIHNVYYLRKRIEEEKYAEVAVGSVCRNLFKKGLAEEADNALEALCSIPFRAVFRGRSFAKRNVFSVHAHDMPFDDEVLGYLKTIFHFLFVSLKGSECVLEVRMEQSALGTELIRGEVYDIRLQSEKYLRHYGAGIDLRVFQIDLVQQEEKVEELGVRELQDDSEEEEKEDQKNKEEEQEKDRGECARGGG